MESEQLSVSWSIRWSIYLNSVASLVWDLIFPITKHRIEQDITKWTRSNQAIKQWGTLYLDGRYKHVIVTLYGLHNAETFNKQWMGLQDTFVRWMEFWTSWYIRPTSEASVTWICSWITPYCCICPLASFILAQLVELVIPNSRWCIVSWWLAAE